MAWRFNGQTDYATLAANAALSLPQNGSLGGWAYRTDSRHRRGLPVDARGHHGQSLLVLGVVVRQRDGILLRTGAVLYERFRGDCPFTFTGSPPSQAGSWHHVMATWDATALRLYVDGVMGEESNEELQDSIFPLAPNATLYLGRNTAATLISPVIWPSGPSGIGSCPRPKSPPWPRG